MANEFKSAVVVTCSEVTERKEMYRGVGTGVVVTGDSTYDATFLMAHGGEVKVSGLPWAPKAGATYSLVFNEVQPSVVRG